MLDKLIAVQRHENPQFVATATRMLHNHFSYYLRLRQAAIATSIS